MQIDINEKQASLILQLLVSNALQPQIADDVIDLMVKCKKVEEDEKD